MADPIPTVSATFRKPFPEQVAAFRLRLAELRPTFGAADPRYQGHGRAFMVAGAVKADLLADLASAVDKAVSQGTTYDTFRKDFRELVTRNGWHGWTGEGDAQGEEWRMRTIYRTNMRTSYMSGRHAQLVKGNFKFWIYRHSGAAHPRLNHLSWDGIALPPDHPFWFKHFPPNGWGCGCDVYGTNSAAGVRRLGGDPDKVLPDNWDSIDPRTGLPPGIGKGWGEPMDNDLASNINALAPKLETLPPGIAIDALQDWVTSELFTAWLAAPKGKFPLARLREQDAARISADRSVAHVSAQTAAEQLRRSPDVTAANFARAQAILSAPSDVVAVDAQQLLFVQPDPDSVRHLLIVRVERQGETVFITSVRHVLAADWQQGNGPAAT